MSELEPAGFQAICLSVTLLETDRGRDGAEHGEKEQGSQKVHNARVFQIGLARRGFKG